MKIALVLFVPSILIFAGCASKTKVDFDKLEKYRHCNHHNPKLTNACIKKNEAGEHTTALELENKAFPGQYQ